jgi:cytochrome c biogenesis protein CcdA
MLVGSFWPDTPWAKEARRRREARGEPSRISRWADAVAADSGRPLLVVGVALSAALVEAASMLPYLGAIALISTSADGVGLQLLVLAAYVVVMVLPALVLLACRVAAAERIGPHLERLSAWLMARAGGAMWWVVGILGFFLAADAAGRLALL